MPGLPSFTLGDSSKLNVGDVVFAIGDPFGVGETATMGIVSATGRGLGGGIEHYEEFIQTHAAISRGSGALDLDWREPNQKCRFSEMRRVLTGSAVHFCRMSSRNSLPPTLLERDNDLLHRSFCLSLSR